MPRFEYRMSLVHPRSGRKALLQPGHMCCFLGAPTPKQVLAPTRRNSGCFLRELDCFVATLLAMTSEVEPAP